MRHMCCVQSFRLGKCTLKSSSRDPESSLHPRWALTCSKWNLVLCSEQQVPQPDISPQDKYQVAPAQRLWKAEGKGYFGEGKWVARHYLLGQEAQFCQKLLGQCHLLLHVALSQTLQELQSLLCQYVLEGQEENISRGLLLGAPDPPFPDRTRLCTSSFPRHRSRVLGRVIVLRSAPWQNCLQDQGQAWQTGVKGRNTNPQGPPPSEQASYTQPPSQLLLVLFSRRHPSLAKDGFCIWTTAQFIQDSLTLEPRIRWYLTIYCPGHSKCSPGPTALVLLTQNPRISAPPQTCCVRICNVNLFLFADPLVTYGSARARG